jgi:hypothetical protein
MVCHECHYLFICIHGIQTHLRVPRQYSGFPLFYDVFLEQLMLFSRFGPISFLRSCHCKQVEVNSQVFDGFRKLAGFLFLLRRPCSYSLRDFAFCSFKLFVTKSGSRFTLESFWRISNIFQGIPFLYFTLWIVKLKINQL